MSEDEPRRTLSDGTQKQCRKCGEVKDIADFSSNNTMRDGRRSSCRQCESKAQRDRFAAGGLPTYLKKKKIIESRRRDIVTRVYRYLSDHPCVDCGESDPIVLDLDHVRGNKVAAISQLISHARKWEFIVAEIGKCDVRCANCHRRKTAKELGWYSYIPEVGGHRAGHATYNAI